MKSFTLSDIHLGHDVNKTVRMVDNLRRFFATHKSYLVTIDVMFISGDTFDKLLASASSELTIAFGWLTELVMFCKEYHIKLRILEGTPSHDWKQVKLFTEVIDKLNLDVDFKYFDNVAIENIDGLDVLYVPDEIRGTPAEILKLVKETLRKHKLDKVDMAIMHGAFRHQLPDFIEHLLDEDDYLEIVRGPIIIGHVHTRSKFKRIIVPGSFETLTHADAGETKGGLLLEYRKGDTKFNFKYLDNRRAMKFVTITAGDKEFNAVTKLLKRQVTSGDMNVSIKVSKDSKLSENIMELRDLYPGVRITINKETKKKQKDEPIDSDIKLAKDVILNKRSVKEYVTAKSDELEDPILAANVLKLLDKIHYVK